MDLRSILKNIETEVLLDSFAIRIRKRTFCSPGLDEEYTYFLSQEINKDNDIESNTSFDYYSMENLDNPVSPGIIFLFHGLNEKKWDKYLPWAYQLTKLTGKTVILFPIAFHMNRAPLEWSNSRLMQKLSITRAAKSANSHSSFVNAAISERLDSYPQRFLLSGLQTYTDFCRLVELIRRGDVHNIHPDSSIDLFGYSIGAFFSLLLMMDNPKNLLTNARLFMFCGGATYDKTFPVSKYIVDKSASTSVAFFLDKMFKNKVHTEKVINRCLEKLLPRQSYFTGLMNYKQFKDLREKRLSRIYERIKVIVLERDRVVVPQEVIDSLSVKAGGHKSNIDVMDFNFPYSHVSPFPLVKKYNLQVDKSFKYIMEKAGEFLS
jgi:hypothetical protein